MKTPEEIKKALRVCQKGWEMHCVGCPYKDSGIMDCFETLLMRDALDYIEKLETEKKAKNDDLISRKSVVERLREKGRRYTASMFATSSELDIARIITLECVNEVRNMPAYSKGEDE